MGIGPKQDLKTGSVFAILYYRENSQKKQGRMTMNDVKITKKQELIPTYIPKKPNDLPMFFENKP